LLPPETFHQLLNIRKISILDESLKNETHLLPHTTGIPPMVARKSSDRKRTAGRLLQSRIRKTVDDLAGIGGSGPMLRLD